jgi:hypothetical protein
MKRLKQIAQNVLFCLFVLVMTTGCKEEEEKFTQFPAPVWQVNSNAYSVNMTAVVKLPAALDQYAQSDDQLAVFSGNVCRGIGVNIKGLYYVAILGNADDQGTIRFSYYSARNQYLYTTAELFSFDADRIFGTTDEPEVLTLTIVK